MRTILLPVAYFLHCNWSTLTEAGKLASLLQRSKDSDQGALDDWMDLKPSTALMTSCTTCSATTRSPSSDYGVATADCVPTCMALVCYTVNCLCESTLAIRDPHCPCQMHTAHVSVSHWPCESQLLPIWDQHSTYVRHRLCEAQCSCDTHTLPVWDTHIAHVTCTHCLCETHTHCLCETHPACVRHTHCPCETGPQTPQHVLQSCW